MGLPPVEIGRFVGDAGRSTARSQRHGTPSPPGPVALRDNGQTIAAPEGLTYKRVSTRRVRARRRETAMERSFPVTAAARFRALAAAALLVVVTPATLGAAVLTVAS